jgi:CHAD domain-containing protein
MTYIELPRAVEAYFAFAELPATERGRQFTITFTYFEGTRLDRLQWWWQVSRAQERAGEALVQGLRQEAILRFKQHIERWLVNSRRCLRGGEPFPLLETLVSEEPASVAEAPAAETSKESDYVETVREFARIAARR